MGRKFKVKPKLKISAVKEHLNGLKSVIKISDELSVNKSAVRQWIKTYQSTGEYGMITKSGNSSYSKELKITAVEEY